MARALGRYELLRPLARGGMAEVFLARRRAAGIEKWLVVKRMRPETSGDPRFLDLFVREARLSMSLAHQNIVPVFDFGRIDDQVFLAMERIEGRDLGSTLARAAGRRMPPLVAAFIASECCQALDYAHQRKSPDGVALGIVHRDVTPRNVLLSWSGEVKLTDFGIAALAGDATSRLLGTPHYMAPEQARSEAIDPRADLYALGLVMREAVSGVRARPGSDRETILEAARRGELVAWPHLARPPTAPEDMALGSGDHSPPDAPPEALRAIIERATAASPDDRYADARAMLEELDEFMVAERAARKADAPARQLAAWLTEIWQGSHDDDAADAAAADALSGGDDMVSFMDDGGIEHIGTGTVRSLAATAAEDVPSGKVARAPSTIEVSAEASQPTRVGDPEVRPGRVSSSTATVASGSFHAMAAPEALPAPRADDAGGTSKLAAQPAPRSRATIAAVVFAVIAAGAIAFAFLRGAPVGEAPRPAVVAAPAAPAAPAAVEAPHVEPAPVETPHVEVIAPAVPVANDARPERPKPGHNAPAPARPKSGQPRPNPGTSAGSGSAVAEGAPAPVAPTGPKPCRVRINLTPWAYYTADGDPTRHETPSTIELAPGPHKLHVWNPELDIARDIVINVPADRDTMNYSEPLRPTKLP